MAPCLMASGKRWNRDELLIVLNLYHKLRFGQFDQRQPVVIDLAERMGRTPSSISMKLGNLASFDPALKLRGIVALPGASNLDREAPALIDCAINLRFSRSKRVTTAA